jgi:hypothetical protein
LGYAWTFDGRGGGDICESMIISSACLFVCSSLFI